MNEIVEISSLFQSFYENLNPKESSSLEIKKSFLVFQLQKLVQAHSDLKECLRELEDLDHEWNSLSKTFTQESKLIGDKLKKQKCSLIREFDSDIASFLENVKTKTADDSKADAMAKVIFLNLMIVYALHVSIKIRKIIVYL